MVTTQSGAHRGNPANGVAEGIGDEEVALSIQGNACRRGKTRVTVSAVSGSPQARRAGNRERSAAGGYLPYRVVFCVGHKDVAPAIHRHARGVVKEPVGPKLAGQNRVSAGRAGQSGHRASGGHHAHPVGPAVGDIDIARAVQGQARGAMENGIGPQPVQERGAAPSRAVRGQQADEVRAIEGGRWCERAAYW